MARIPMYKDDKLESKCIRLSKKYELAYVIGFIKILRKFRKQAISFVEKFTGKV